LEHIEGGNRRLPLSRNSGKSMAGMPSYGRLPYENISHNVTPITYHDNYSAISTFQHELSLSPQNNSSLLNTEVQNFTLQL